MLKGVFDIESILHALSIEPLGTTARGRIKAFCPVHPRRETHPRHWTMDPETGMWHCFSCNQGGSIVTLVTELTDMGVWDAIGWLRSEGLQQIVFERPRVEEEEARAAEQVIAAIDAEDQWALFDPPPREQLESRQILAAGADHFDVRWAKGEADNEFLLRSEAWAFPLLQWDGKFLGYQLKAKKFVKNVPTGVQKERSFFGIAQFPVGDRAVIVESPLDAVRLWGLGYSALAVMGAWMSDAQVELLTASTNKVLVAMDYDAAGRQEARRLLGVLQGMSVQFMDYRVVDRREDGKRPKDVGEMDDDEIHEAILHSRLPHECGRLLGPKPEPKRQFTSRTKRRRRGSVR